jgi:hypothetical protein
MVKRVQVENEKYLCRLFSRSGHKKLVVFGSTE